MPYKASLKAGEPRNRPTPNYPATNAHEYNESLKRRGQLSLYCPDGDSDEAGLGAVLAVEANVDCVIADGAYYSISQAQAWSTCGVLPVIPPPANTVVHNQPATRLHDHLVRYIKTSAFMRSETNTGAASAHGSNRSSARTWSSATC